MRASFRPWFVIWLPWHMGPEAIIAKQILVILKGTAIRGAVVISDSLMNVLAAHTAKRWRPPLFLSGISFLIWHIGLADIKEPHQISKISPNVRFEKGISAATLATATPAMGFKIGWKRNAYPWNRFGLRLQHVIIPCSRASGQAKYHRKWKWLQ